MRALRGVTLTIEEGEFVAVMGPSGCGKSTLLHLAGALESPSAGSVRVGGRELAGLGAAACSELRRNDVGYVFQRLNLIPSLTAIENVMLPLELSGGSHRAVRQQAIARAGDGRAHATTRPLSGRLLRRATAAHRDRAGDRRPNAGCCSPTNRPVRSTPRAATK